MSNYDTTHSRSPNRPIGDPREGSGLSVWVVGGLMAVFGIIGVFMVGPGGNSDGNSTPIVFETAPAPIEGTAN